MPVLLAGIFALLTLKQEHYDPARHLAWIQKQVVIATKLGRSLRDKKTPVKEAADIYGKMLADSRTLQTNLSKFITKADKPGAKIGLRAIQAAGLLDAWITSAIFALDGDQSAKDLAANLEKRLAQLLKSINETAKGG